MNKTKTGRVGGIKQQTLNTAKKTQNLEVNVTTKTTTATALLSHHREPKLSPFEVSKTRPYEG